MRLSGMAGHLNGQNLDPPEAKNSAKSSGCVSNCRSPAGSVIHGCLLRVQICAVGPSHDVSSNEPARTPRNAPATFGAPVMHDPQSEQTQRGYTRPLSAVRSTTWGSPSVRWNASSTTMTVIEKELAVIF